MVQRPDGGMRRRIEQYLIGIWYRGRPVPWLLALLELVYRAASGLRAAAYRRGLRRIVRVGVPVVVVGNITVGGTGKTPFVVWLAAELACRGWRPGIVLRGYGGRSAAARLVVPTDDPDLVGDEAVLLARTAGVPVATARRRAEAALLLRARAGCDVIISDDGLQHWALGRDLELVLIDGERRLGNGRLLPAGPLREPVIRLASVDYVIANGVANPGEIAMRVEGRRAFALAQPGVTRELPALAGNRVHAVAGTGNPERFFAMLERFGIVVERHALPDHYRYRGGEFAFGDGLPVLTTEKDAVKCGSDCDAEVYVVPVDAILPPEFADLLHLRLHDARTRAQP